jgi:cytochrome c556
MRIVVLVLLAIAALAQAPSFTPKPVGNLKQVMKSILFPNSNIIFDVQANTPKDDAAWQTVQNSAIALAESASLIAMPGRLREDGKPVPVQRADWIKFSNGLVAAARKTYQAAQSKNQAAVADSTNDLSDACSNCHEIYRDAPQR